MLHDLRTPDETSDSLQGGVQGMPRGLRCSSESGAPLQGQCLSALHSLTGALSFCCQELSLAQGVMLSSAFCCSLAAAAAASGPALLEHEKGSQGWGIYKSCDAGATLAKHPRSGSRLVGCRSCTCVFGVQAGLQRCETVCRAGTQLSRVFT